MNRGKYIVLEGPEGVGKTTQLHELAHRLEAAGLPVRILREPDSQSDLTARAIRQLTQDPQYPMNTRTEVLLYNAARSQSLQTIKSSIENGVICLVDRNYLTTLAIQYYGRGDVPDYNTINGIINFAVGEVEPDLCIVMDAPVTTLRERLQHRNNGERFDNLDDAFLERVRSGYLWEAKQRGFPVVFATESADTVADNVWQLVSANLAVRNGQAATDSEPASVKEIMEHSSMPVRAIKESPDSPQDNSLSLKGISGLCVQRLKASRLTAIQELGGDSGYYVPNKLKPGVKKQYQEAMETIFKLRSTMLEKLEGSYGADEALEAVKALLPLSAKTDVLIEVSEEAIDSAVVRLLSAGLPECHKTGKELLEQAQDNKPSLDKIQAKVSNLTVAGKAFKQLSDEYLPDTHALSPNEMVTLIDYWPKNELLLVPDMLYANSNLPLEQLQSVVNDWPYDKKSLAFKSYARQRQQPGRALEKAHYSWDIMSDYNTYDEFQNHHFVDDLSWQPLTPRYGYEVPAIIEKTGLTDQFETCFDISLKLYRLLQKEGYTVEAQYAVLRGHKMRWKVTYNARTAFRICQSTDKFARQMHEKLSEIHPLLGESIDASAN